MSQVESSVSSEYCFIPDIQVLPKIEKLCCVETLPSPLDMINEQANENIIGLEGLYKDCKIRFLDCSEDSCIGKEVCCCAKKCSPAVVYDCKEVLSALSKGMVPFDPCNPLKDIEKTYPKECCAALTHCVAGDYTMQPTPLPEELSRQVVATTTVAIEEQVADTKIYVVSLSPRGIEINKRMYPRLHLRVGSKYIFRFQQDSSEAQFIFTKDKKGIIQLHGLAKATKNRDMELLVTKNTPKEFYYTTTFSKAYGYIHVD
jgi:hypothetical protein